MQVFLFNISQKEILKHTLYILLFVQHKTLGTNSMYKKMH
jgi:hypothetical protein